MNEKTLIRDVTQGNPMKQLLSFAFPFVLANLLQQAYNMADMVIVGQVVGSAGLAAASAGGELAMLFLFIPAVARDRLQKRNDRLREGMDSEDNRVAVCAAFRYAVTWLKAAGVDFSNLPYGSVSDRVQEIVSPERAEAFSSMVPLWQEAQFSDHVVSDDARATLSRFQEDTAQEIWSSKNRREQLRLRWKHALWI